LSRGAPDTDREREPEDEQRASNATSRERVCAKRRQPDDGRVHEPRKREHRDEHGSPTLSRRPVPVGLRGA
jgi:hypothetical protein